MKRTLTLPKGTSERLIQELASKIQAWHIVTKVDYIGCAVTWEQSQGYGPGAESLSAFVEGFMLGCPKTEINYHYKDK